MYCVIALGSIVPLMKVLLCCNHFFYHDKLLFMKEQGRTFIPREILHQRCWFNILFTQWRTLEKKMILINWYVTFRLTPLRKYSTC